MNSGVLCLHPLIELGQHFWRTLCECIKNQYVHALHIHIQQNTELDFFAVLKVCVCVCECVCLCVFGSCLCSLNVWCLNLDWPTQKSY